MQAIWKAWETNNQVGGGTLSKDWTIQECWLRVHFGQKNIEYTKIKIRGTDGENWGKIEWAN